MSGIDLGNDVGNEGSPAVEGVASVAFASEVVLKEVACPFLFGGDCGDEPLPDLGVDGLDPG